VIILEISSSFPPGWFRQRMKKLSHHELPITCNGSVTFKGARESTNTLMRAQKPQLEATTHSF